MSTIADLAALVGGRTLGDSSVSITDVELDSRRVADGMLFCCVTGAVHDGHEFASAAVAAGAAALLCERDLGLGVPQIIVDDVRVAMAPIAAEVHGRPSERLDVIGVTGTNGKTTVISMVAAVLAAAGRSVRTIGTLTGERTTPEAPDLQRTLAQFERDGVDSVAMEVSSHALALHRADSISFSVGVFTNLGIDHLDFHGTPEAYFAAKAALFDPGRCDVGVVNTDDIRGRLLMDASDGDMRGVSVADALDLREGRDGSTFIWRGQPVSLPLPGRHNVSNALLAAEACRAIGLDEPAIAAGLGTVPVIPGRFETIRAEAGPTVVVDFAHTPDALEQVLVATRGMTAGHGRVAVVFGCGGDRDAGKRPMMGEVACRLADRVIVTTDNPRSEDPAAIIEQIVAGCAGPFEIVADREEAIRSAVATAAVDDIVVVAGKGHEQGQIFADRVVPFDDRDVVRAALSEVLDGPEGTR